MTRNYCLLIFITVFISAFNLPDSTNIPMEDGAWFNHFQTLTSLDEQLNAIKLKVKRDSICDQSGISCAGVGEIQLNRERWESKARGPIKTIMFVLNAKGKHLNLDWNKESQTADILEQLSPNKMDSIVVFPPRVSSALYGYKASTGLIFLFSSSDEIHEVISD